MRKYQQTAALGDGPATQPRQPKTDDGGDYAARRAKHAANYEKPKRVAKTRTAKREKARRA